MANKIGTRTQPQKGQRLFTLCGIVAPILFTFLVVVAGLLRPGYSQISNFVSDLGVGPHAILQNANFVVFGLLSMVFALGLRGGLPIQHGRALKASVWLILIFGLGVLVAGVFPVNPLGPGPHDLASGIAFLVIVAAQLLTWQGLRSADRSVWGRYRTYSRISGLLSIILLLIFRVAIGGAYQGIVQRAFLMVPWLWIEVTGLKLYSLLNTEEGMISEGGYSF